MDRSWVSSGAVRVLSVLVDCGDGDCSQSQSLADVQIADDEQRCRLLVDRVLWFSCICMDPDAQHESPPSEQQRRRLHDHVSSYREQYAVDALALSNDELVLPAEANSRLSQESVAW